MSSAAAYSPMLLPERNCSRNDRASAWISSASSSRLKFIRLLVTVFFFRISASVKQILDIGLRALRYVRPLLQSIDVFSCLCLAVCNVWTLVDGCPVLQAVYDCVDLRVTDGGISAVMDECPVVERYDMTVAVEKRAVLIPLGVDVDSGA